MGAQGLSFLGAHDICVVAQRVVAWLSTCRMCWPTIFRGRPKIYVDTHKTSWVSIHIVWTSKNRCRWMSTRLRGSAQNFVGTQMIAWPSKDFVDECGCPRPKTFRGCPYNVMGIQNFVVAQRCPKRGSPPCAWAPNNLWIRGCEWPCMDAQISWAYMDERGHLCGRPKSRCLGRPCCIHVDAHYRGACWMSMCAQDGRPTHTHVGRPGRVDMDTQNGRVHVLTSMPRAVDTPISHTSSTTKLFTRRLRLVRQVFQNFLCSNA